MRFLIGVLFLLASCSPHTNISSSTYGVVAGAGWTTFDVKQGGCNDGPNGIDCNNYESKNDVYMNGGPVSHSVSDGWYYFAVLVPGYQNGGFLEGADGNLSDETKGKTRGDHFRCGDSITERTFQVENAEIVNYAGSHKTGTSPNGKFIIQLMPYCDTSNNGGVYILAVCVVGAAKSSECKFDAFRVAKVKGKKVPPEFPQISGRKYYDANGNGQYDVGEVGLVWPLTLSGVVDETIYTGSDGTFSLEVIEGTYSLYEQNPVFPWIQTGNVVDQTVVSGDASVVLEDKRYSLNVSDDSSVSGLNFGNVCVGAGGGHTPGFWSNQNGQALFGADDLAMLVGLNLRNADGSHFDPASYEEFREWLLGSTAVNMAYKLSSHLAAMMLNVLNGLVDGDALIYVGGQFASVSEVMDEANASLGLYGFTQDGTERTVQEGLKNALDDANNNKNFLQSNLEGCQSLY